MALLSGARLCVLRKKGDGVIREVPIRTNFVKIGSEVHCTIRLKSELTEQLHCKIFVRNEKVMIANYSSKNPITVDGKVINKRGPLSDGSVIEVCGTRFRWQFDESLLPARTEKSKKVQPTPTSSKFGKSRRTTMALKKAQPIEESETVTESSRKSGSKKSQKSPTYTLPKSNKQLMKNIKKRFTMHSVLVDHQSDDEDDEETDEDESEQNESSVSSPEVVEPLAETPTKLITPSSVSSPEVVESLTETPKKLMTPDVSKNNTPFYTPEPEKENQTPVTIGKTPQTPRTPALENSAMMILSYTPVIGPRVKTNLQKTPLSKKKADTPQLRSGYLTPKNDNILVSNIAAKSQSVSKVGNSMYLIDLTSPATANDSSFVYSQSDGSFSSSAGLIDLTTPPSKKLRTPSSTVAKSAQKGLLRSALKNASKTPLSGLRSRLVKETPKSVAKIRLDESIINTPTTPAKGQKRSRPTTPASTTTSKLRSQTRTPTVDSLSISSKPETPKTITNCQDETSKETPVMTTDDLFDTLVGRPSIKKTYTRKSDSPKKHPLPLVSVEGSSELPKTDVDLWVESVVTEATSPPAEPLESFIKKPNRTTQVRSSQYSDITPHESFTDPHNAVPVDPQEATNEKDVSVPLSDDELINMDDKPSIPHAARKSHTPLASKIARSLGNKRQTIGNFFTNMFGKLTVSPVTRVSITDENPSEAVEDLDHDNSEHESDGSEEVYHDSESDHPQEIEKPTEVAMNPSPKLRQSLRDTRKFIGNALTSLNTSKLTMDNTAEIDESLLLSDTYEENVTNQTEAADEHYDLTDLSAIPDATQSNMSTPAKSTRKTFSRDFRAEISPMVGNDNRFIRQVSTPAGRRSTRQRPDVDISPLAVPIRGTPAKSSPSREANSTETEQETSMHVNDETQGSFTPVASGSAQLETVTDIDQNSPMDVASEDNAANSSNASRLESSSADHSFVSPAKEIVSPSPLCTRLSKRVSRSSSANATQHEEQSSAAEEFASDVTSAEHSNINQSQLIESIIGPEQQNDSINEPNADDSNAHVENVMEIVESVATPTESPATTAPSTPLPEIRSKRSARQSIAVMDGKTSTASEENSNKTVPMSESKLPLRVHRLTKRSPLSETETVESSNASPGSNSTVTETVTQDVDEEEASPVRDATNVDNSVLEGQTTDYNAVESQEQSTSSETAFESPIRRGRSSLKQTQTPERLSMTAERQVRRPANGTPLFRKAIFAMCTPTRTSRSSVTKAAPQEETTSRMSRSSRRTTVGEMASVVNEASPIVVAEVDDHVPEQLEASAIISSPAQHTPRTRGSVSNVTTPASTPRTPASVRKSLLTTKAAGSATPTTKVVERNDLSIDEHESVTSTEQCAICEITEGDAVSELTSSKVSRRSTIARKETTPDRQGLIQAEIDVHSESTSQADLEQSSLGQAECDTSLVEQLSESVASPVHADQSKKSSSIKSTPASARKSLRKSSECILAPGEQSIQIANESINTQNFETTATAIDNSSAHEEVLNSSGNTKELAVDQSGYDETPVRASRRSTMNKTRESIAIPTPAEQTSRSRRSSAIQTLTSAKKQTSACDEDSSFVEHQNTSIPKDGSTEDTLNRSVPNVSLDHHTNVNEDVQVQNVTTSDAEPDSSLDDNDLQESMANQTPIKNTSCTRGRLSKSDTPVSTPASDLPKQLVAIKTPSSVRKSLLKPSQQLELIPEKTVDQDESISTTTDTVTPVKTVDTSRLELTPRSVCPVTPIGLDVVFKTPRPVRGTRTPLATLKKTPATPVPQSNVSGQTVGRRSTRRGSSMGKVNDTNEDCQENQAPVTELFSSPIGNKTTPTKLNSSDANMSPFVVEETPRKTVSPSEDATDECVSEKASSTTSSVELCPDLLKHLCERVITLEHAMENLEDPSQQSMDVTAANSTETLEGIKQLLATPAATSTVRKKLLTSSALAVLNETVDLEGLGELLKSPAGDAIGSEIRKALRLSTTSTELEAIGDEESKVEGVHDLMETTANSKRSLSEVSSTNETTDASVNLEGVQHLLKTPAASVSKKPSKSALSTPLNETVSDATANLEGMQQMLATPQTGGASIPVRFRSTRSSTVALDSTMPLEGVHELLKTPAVSASNTSSIVNETICDTTADLEGIQQMLSTPQARDASMPVRTRNTRRSTAALDSTLHLEGVRKLLQTPVAARVLHDDSCKLEGVHDLLKTPAVHAFDKSTSVNETSCDATADLEGVQQMLATPHAGDTSLPVRLRSTRSSTAALDSTLALEGVRKLLQTPVAARVLSNDSSNLEGIHDLLKTPAFNESTAVNETVCDTTADLDGLQQMQATPNVSVAAFSVSEMDNTTDLEGVKHLLKTPVASNESYSLEGVQQLVQTPAASKKLTPSSKSTIVKDNKQHMPTTPHDGSMSMKHRSTRSSTSALNSTAHLDGVKHLLKTPVAARVLPNDSYNLEGVQELLQTPAPTVRKSMRTSTAIKTLDLAGNSPIITNQTVDTLTASISNELFDTSETELNASTTAQVEDMTATNAEVVDSAIEQVDPNSSTSASDSVNLEGIQHLMKTPITARKSLRNSTLKTSDATVVDSPNLTGVQELMTTPMAKSATKNNVAVPKTPGVANLEGVQQLFKTPVAPVSSRKPLRSSTVIEPIRFDESSILEESQQSASLNDSSKLEAVQQLMKTPATVGKSLRSTVSTDVNSLVPNSQNLTGVGQLMTTPQASTSRRVSKVQRIAAASNTTDRNETVDMEGVQQLLTTPNTTAALNSSDDLDGLQQLLGTPVTETSPNNSCNLEGIQRLMTTPAASKKSLRSSVAATDLNLTGLQQLMATPQATSTVKRSTTAPITPSVDTNLDGVQQMFKTPVAPSGSRKNKRSNATTKMNLDESINFEGLQQLLGTPVASTPIVRSARKKHMNDSNLEGVEQLLKMPVANVAAADTTPTNNASTSAPVEAPSTPIQPASLRKKVELASPVVKEAASIEAVDQLNTPRESSTAKTAHKTAQGNSINLSSVQHLFQTPNPPSTGKRRKQNTKTADGKRVLDNSVALEDIKELLRTPIASTTTKKLDDAPLNDTVNMEGLHQLLETPAEKQTSKQIVLEESVSLEGVEQLLKTPTVTDKTSVVEADKLENKVDSSGVSGAPSDRSSDLFSPPVDEQTSSDTVNVAGIIEMLNSSALTPVEDKSGETPVASTSNSIEQIQVDVPSQTPIPTKLGVNISVAVATEVGTPTTQRLRRKLYTKNDPDDKTPERIKTTVVRPVTSNEYLNIMDPNSIAKDESSEEKRNRLGKKLTKPTEELTDSESESSDYEDVKDVEPVRKILPSRASRRNIKTLSEEALAGASPELKYVKPKPPKVIEEPTPVTVVTTAEVLPTINEDSAINSQDLSAGRRKVMFNENIQIKEINSPAIVGDIIQKVSRGRGGKHQKVVQVIVEQHSIKPARRENKQEQKPDESTPVEELETDSSKRTRRGVKRVNYAEESMDKPSEATKRTRRGANKADNAEKIVLAADATATKTVEDENPKRSKREADDSSDPATGVETTSSVNVEDTFDKKTHSTPSESSLPDEKNAVEESTTNSTTMQTSNTASTTSFSGEVKEAEETEEEPKTKRTRRPATKSKAPKKASSRARSKKADSVSEESHDEVAAEPNVSENPTGKEEKSGPIMNDNAGKSSVDTQVLPNDAATPLTKDKVDESDKVDEDSVAKRSRRTVKKKPEPQKSSARAKSKKTDTVQEEEVSHETPSTPEESAQAVPPVNQELSHHAVEDITDTNVEPVIKRSRRAPQKATKDITPSEATDIALPSSTDDSKTHEETDAAVVSPKRVAKKGSTRTAKKKTAELPSDSAEAKAVESKASEATEEVKVKPAPRATAAKGRQRRGVATKVKSIDDVASSMEHQTTAASTETSTEVALPTVPVVEAPIVEQAVADSTSQDEPQPAPAKRGRNARKPAAKSKVLTAEASKDEHEQSEVSTMPPPAMIITPEPTAAASKKPARRGRQKAVVEEQHPELHHTIEESLNESHMVKTMLPSSHTSTPLMRIEEEKPKLTKGGRSRKLNPVVAALIEDDANTPSRRSPRSLRAGSESRTEDSQSVASTSNTKQSRARATSKMSSVDDSHEQSEKKVATITEEETTEDNETADALPTGKSRARRNPPTKRTRGKAAEQPESEELEEVVPKRNRKAPAKYRDAQPDSGTKSEDTEEANIEPAKASARSRRGAKSTKPAPEPTVTTTDATETNDESEAVAQSKPSRSRKVATKRPAATRKKVDVDTEDDEASVVKQAREDEEPVEATSSRRRPLRTRK